jgi:ligand-binding sensor domain-containing protein
MNQLIIPWKVLLAICPVIAILFSCKPEDDSVNSIAGKKVRAIHIETNGTKWFATDKGISSFDGKTWTNFDENDGLAQAGYNGISKAAPAGGTNLWLASTGGTLRGHWDSNILTVETSYTTTNSELLSDTVLAIALDKAGFLWMGTAKGLNGLKNNTDWILPSKQVFTLPISSIGTSEDGWNYFATLGGGVGRNKTTVDGVSSASTYEMPWAGLPSDIVNTLYIDPSTGNQWFGTPAGAAYHTGTETKKNWTVYTTLDGLVNDEILSIAGDADGNIWFGTQGGVSKFSHSAWTTYTETEGLVNNTVCAIAFDLDGSVWLGTENGVSHYASGSWVNYR